MSDPADDIFALSIVEEGGPEATVDLNHAFLLHRPT